MVSGFTISGVEVVPPHPPCRPRHGDLSPQERGEVKTRRLRRAKRGGSQPHLAPLLRGEVAEGHEVTEAGEGSSPEQTRVATRLTPNPIHTARGYDRVWRFATLCRTLRGLPLLSTGG